MLSIRRRQFDDIAHERFAARVAEFLRAQFVEARLVEQKELQKVAGRQIARAGRYGLEQEIHVMSYVLSAWLLGEKFDEEFAAAASTLRNAVMSRAEKAQWLDQWTVSLFEALEDKSR